MNLQVVRQILKGCADDTRLRIIHLLNNNELTVKDICTSLQLNQPTISKHLTRLRLLKLVIDKRKGNSVYYSLNRTPNSIQNTVISFINTEFSHLERFKKDRKAINAHTKT